ncbi:sensor histidine kinase [Paenibacillus abyssi]|uniref:histidine kinase n=1 Tax=Paenibacillus abyssi TaxID=1340531 RepID=A0A917CM42_9BACL|nr:HAMP domain-containing sensor histidine kinase [Paenibacillus abyssi]GGF90765.1 two-component sensor histidine kinase [Paenibacillus abyssi]
MRVLKLNSIASKLGTMLVLIFLALILLIEGVLYGLFIRFYTNDTISYLNQRSHNYATILTDHFDPATMEHVVSMESSSNNLLLILDASGNILRGSQGISQLSLAYLNDIITHGNEGHGPVIASNWKEEDYFVTEADISSDGQTVGKVIMFSPTSPIRKAVATLNTTFIGVAIIGLVISAVLIYLVSNRIVQPLLRIIHITKRISDGHHDWELTQKGTDEIAQLSKAVNQMSQNIQYYKQQRNQFLADISHELRTPLTYIKGYSELLNKDQIPDDQDRNKYLSLLHSQSIQLQRLVQDLFDLANLEQGSFTFECKRISVEKVILNALDLMAEPIQSASISLTYSPSPASIYVWGDERRLQQVIINLLENAKRYTNKDGTIHLATHNENNLCFIKVSDTGIGIPAKDLPHIWERLYRVDKSRSRVTGGAGLGLAICKEIITLHKGDISIDSVEGVGTTFTITLPPYSADS